MENLKLVQKSSATDPQHVTFWPGDQTEIKLLKAYFLIVRRKEESILIAGRKQSRALKHEQTVINSALWFSRMGGNRVTSAGTGYIVYLYMWVKMQT